MKKQAKLESLWEIKEDSDEESNVSEIDIWNSEYDDSDDEDILMKKIMEEDDEEIIEENPLLT